MEAARMTARDYRIFGAFLKRANFDDGEIPEKFQFRSLEKLTAACFMSRTAVADGLNHLEQHGWVERRRMAPGRGRSTFYVLGFGVDCNCPDPSKRAAPTTEAQRAREYRARRKASGIHVTDSESSRGKRVTKRPGVRDGSAGQDAVLAERAREEGSRGRDYQGGPVPWDPEEVDEWLNQTGCGRQGDTPAETGGDR
jgi:hypothetical protein